jgi:hypothetical protein
MTKVFQGDCKNETFYEVKPPQRWEIGEKVMPHQVTGYTRSTDADWERNQNRAYLMTPPNTRAYIYRTDSSAVVVEVKEGTLRDVPLSAWLLK